MLPARHPGVLSGSRTFASVPPLLSGLSVSYLVSGYRPIAFRNGRGASGPLAFPDVSDQPSGRGGILSTFALSLAGVIIGALRLTPSCLLRRRPPMARHACSATPRAGRLRPGPGRATPRPPNFRLEGAGCMSGRRGSSCRYLQWQRKTSCRVGCRGARRLWQSGTAPTSGPRSAGFRAGDPFLSRNRARP